MENFKPEAEENISPEKLGVVLGTTQRRLEFMAQKLARFNELKNTLTPDELKKLWEGVSNFAAARDAMDDLLTECLNKDRKI